MADFALSYPLCAKLGLRPVAEVGNIFDPEDVLAQLGPTAFLQFEKTVERVASSPHRSYAADHHVKEWRGCEVHCFYAEDVEKFLASSHFAERRA